MKQLVIIGSLIFIIFTTYAAKRAATYFVVPTAGEYEQRTEHNELSSKELYDKHISNNDNETWKHEYVIIDKTNRTGFLSFETISDTLSHNVFKYTNK